MAKIKANGDAERARWRRDRSSAPGAPYEIVLTERGRLLYKQQRGDSFTLRRRDVTLAHAAAQAAMFRLARV